MEITDIHVANLKFHVEIVVIHVANLKFHVEIVAIHVANLKFHVEIVVIHMANQKLHVEILVLHVAKLKFHVKIVVLHMAVPDFQSGFQGQQHKKEFTLMGVLQRRTPDRKRFKPAGIFRISHVPPLNSLSSSRAPARLFPL